MLAKHGNAQTDWIGALSGSSAWSKLVGSCKTLVSFSVRILVDLALQRNMIFGCNIRIRLQFGSGKLRRLVNTQGEHTGIQK
jgi:hypothetical protein